MVESCMYVCERLIESSNGICGNKGIKAVAFAHEDWDRSSFLSLDLFVNNGILIGECGGSK